MVFVASFKTPILMVELVTPRAALGCGLPGPQTAFAVPKSTAPAVDTEFDANGAFAPDGGLVEEPLWPQAAATTAVTATVAVNIKRDRLLCTLCPLEGVAVMDDGLRAERCRIPNAIPSIDEEDKEVPSGSLPSSLVPICRADVRSGRS
ncbi:MAG TPA: hypothetical protein VFH54_06360 [Mycobacteriales bacterium]|nr:hypothetical protein [Mycobacteriales bacterium]